MKIDLIEATTVSTPLQTPLAFSTRKVTNREHCPVPIPTDLRLDGWAYCYGGTRVGHLVTAFVRDFYREDRSVLPQAARTGIGVDEDAVEHFAVDGWK